MSEQFDDAQLTRYSRHFLLKGFDEKEQAALRSSCVLIVGLGGLGGVVALYLAASGVGELIVNDHDAVDLSNLQRQIIYTGNDLGAAKTDAAQARLQDLNSEVSLTTVTGYLKGEALFDAVARSDLVVDASDNFETRYALNRACVQTETPLVFGAAIATAGQVAVFGVDEDAGCLQCLFDPGQDDPDADCRSAGVFAPLTGMIGSVMAGEAIKVLAGFGAPLDAHLFIIDAADMRVHRARRRREPGCPVCGG